MQVKVSGEDWLLRRALNPTDYTMQWALERWGARLWANFVDGQTLKLLSLFASPVAIS